MEKSLCYLGWVPRRKTAVKKKSHSMGFVDIHFHGAFGIDILHASDSELNELALRLWDHGVGAFCPTTLSVSPQPLRESVGRIGGWIRSIQALPQKQFKGAIPLGIHLEGPFVHPQAVGAQPPDGVRPLDLPELESLWRASHETLCLITLAPELLSPAQLHQVLAWAKKRKIALAMGHSRATLSEATRALDAGIRGITHAWNALPFHQREPGALGAALGRKDKFIELIIDQVHVHPKVIHWTLALHGFSNTCFVSDCVPAAGLSESHEAVRFGPHSIHQEAGASRLSNGSLAGGGTLLTHAFCRWLLTEAKQQSIPASQLPQLWKKAAISATIAPLRYLGLSSALLAQRQLQWHFSSNSVHFSRISR